MSTQNINYLYSLYKKVGWAGSSPYQAITIYTLHARFASNLRFLNYKPQRIRIKNRVLNPSDDVKAVTAYNHEDQTPFVRVMHLKTTRCDASIYPLESKKDQRNRNQSSSCSVNSAKVLCLHSQAVSHH